MKPIYFPYTHIPEQVMKVLKAYFDGIILCMSSKLNIPENVQKSRDEAFLKILTPVEGDEGAISKSMASFQSWANIHEGRSTAFLKSQKENVPFYDDTVTSRIRSEINRYDDEKLKKAQPATLFQARLFLQIAQDFDLNSLDADNLLASLGNMEQDVMSELKGGKDLLFPDHVGGTPLASGGISNYMVPERIRAWCRLMLQADKIPCVFITAGRAAYEYILDNVSEAVTVAEKVHIHPESGVKEKALARQLESLAVKEFLAAGAFELDQIENGQNNKNISVSISVLAGVKPDEFLARCSGSDEIIFNSDAVDKSCRNTVVALFEF